MKRMDFNHWFVGENELGISLMRYFVKIRIRKNEEFIFYTLDIYQDSKSVLEFNFYSLEDAISFTENEMNNSKTTDEIIKKYQEKYKKEEFVSIPTKTKIYQKKK